MLSTIIESTTTMGPITDIDGHASTFWNIEISWESSEDRLTVVQLKQETKLSTIIGLSTMHAGSLPQNIPVKTMFFLYRATIF